MADHSTLMDEQDIADLRRACTATVADDIRAQLADEPEAARESAVALALADPAVRDLIEAAAQRLAGRMH